MAVRALYPWRTAMAVGLGVLKLSPQAFWAMTPRELEAALMCLNHAPQPPERAALAELMARFPDRR